MAKLKRVFGLTSLIIYGVGDILGAGIYALTGKVAGIVGQDMWISFSLALFIALFTAFSYAELSSRYPKSGGASYFAQKAFESLSLGFIVGWVVFFATVVSMATLSTAFTHQVLNFFELSVPYWTILFLFVAVIGYINFSGIKNSSVANMLATFIELSGLLIVIFLGTIWLLESSSSTPTIAPSSDSVSVNSILQGVALAFYAFIGFEDLANVSEETENPEKNVPRSILASLLISGFLYIAVGFIAPRIVDPAALTLSSTPLLDVVRKSSPHFPLFVFSFISFFAIFNTTLLNYVTGSRLLYGMSEQGLLPKKLGQVHSKKGTPHYSILAIFPLIFGLGLIGDLKLLASSTSALLLLVFSVVNISLISVHKKKSSHQGFQVPTCFPFFGLFGSSIAFFYIDIKSLYLAFIVILLGILFFFYRRKFTS